MRVINLKYLHHLGIPVVIILAATIIITFPAIFSFDQGKILRDPYDPVLTAYIIQDNINYVYGRREGGFWTLPIYYPQPYSKTFSEILVTQTLIALPVQLLGADTLQTHNVIFIFMVFLGLAGTYIFLKHFIKSEVSCVLGALFYFNCNYWTDHWGHIQVVSAMGLLPWFTITGFYFFRTPSVRNMLLLALTSLLLNFSNGYYMIFSGIILGTALIVSVLSSSNRETRFKLIKMFSILAIIMILIQFPVIWTYMTVHRQVGLERPFAEINYFSADIINFFQPSPWNKLLKPIHEYKLEGTLFPGPVIFLLAIYELTYRLVRMYQKKKTWDSKVSIPIFILLVFLVTIIITAYYINGYESVLGYIFYPVFIVLVLILYIRGDLFEIDKDDKRLWIRIMFYCAVVSVFICLGPVVKLNNHYLFKSPYYILYSYIPGFNSLRVPARIYPVIQLFLVLFAVHGFTRFRNMFHNNRFQLIVTCVIFLAWTLFNIYQPIPVATVSQHEKTNNFLKQLDGDTLVAFPITLSTSETRRMYDSLFHGKKLVNGYSGHTPPLMRFLSNASKKGLSPGFITYFKRMDVDLVLIDTSDKFWLKELKKILQQNLLVQLARINDEQLAILRIPSLEEIYINLGKLNGSCHNQVLPDEGGHVFLDPGWSQPLKTPGRSFFWHVGQSSTVYMDCLMGNFNKYIVFEGWTYDEFPRLIKLEINGKILTNQINHAGPFKLRFPIPETGQVNNYFSIITELLTSSTRKSTRGKPHYSLVIAIKKIYFTD